MHEAKFVLKEPNSINATLVYLIFRYDNIRLKYSTGIKVLPKDWNPKIQRVRESIKIVGVNGLNKTIIKLKNCVEEEYRDLLNLGIYPKPERLRSKLDECLLKKEAYNEKELVPFIDRLIKDSNKSAGTKRQYRTAHNVIRDYSIYIGKKLFFDDVNIDLYESFLKYLTVEKKYSPNTIGTVIKNLKVFMNEAAERSLTNNIQFRSKRFKKPSENSETIYLSEAEIYKIYKEDFSNDLRLDRVRDSFIIACYTGLRYSDLNQLSEKNIFENGTMIKIRMQKTNEIVVIPIHPLVKEIISKYNGNVPPIISNEKMNLYIKEVAEKAKIEDDVLVSYTKAGMKQNKMYKKFELVTIHTARRSFATNAYLASVPTISIMKITGHRTEKSFLTYIKISQKDNANKILNHPFFK